MQNIEELKKIISMRDLELKAVISTAKRIEEEHVQKIEKLKSDLNISNSLLDTANNELDQLNGKPRMVCQILARGWFFQKWKYKVLCSDGRIYFLNKNDKWELDFELPPFNEWNMQA